jgi:maltokinase
MTPATTPCPLPAYGGGAEWTGDPVTPGRDRFPSPAFHGRGSLMNVELRKEFLHAWISRQRWFAGKGREFSVRGSQELARLAEGFPEVSVCVVTLDYADGGAEAYQLPLVTYDHPVEYLGHVLVAEENGRWTYDALHDKKVTGIWMRHIHGGNTVGDLLFQREPGGPDFPLDEASIVIGAEQSNTSLVFGDAAIFKAYRRLYHGINPDIELHSALFRAGSKHIATPLGWVEGRWDDPVTGQRSTGSLGMLQVYLRTASEGWQLAKTSVRDLFAEADLHPDEVGGDFAGEAHRLGEATAEVHRDLAATLPTDVLGPTQLGELAESMRQRLEAALAVVPELAPYVPPLREVFEEVERIQQPVPVQRIHGDYHLGQVLRTEAGWVTLDFEGEPAKPLRERRALSSPLRDVAGMLRSIDYAAQHLLADYAGDPQLAYRATEWADRNREAFCDGYLTAAGADPREDQALLRAYEIDKAVYEVVYERRHRPHWLRIPLSGIERLAA